MTVRNPSARIRLGEVTPWAPIGITVLATLGAAWLTWRLTANRGFAASAGLLVLGLASAALGTIATVAFIWAGMLGLMAVTGFIVAWPRRR